MCTTLPRGSVEYVKRPTERRHEGLLGPKPVNGCRARSQRRASRAPATRRSWRDRSILPTRSQAIPRSRKHATGPSGAIGRGGEDEAVAREGQEPPGQVDPGGSRKALEVQDGSGAGGLEQHQERPGEACVAHVLARPHVAGRGERSEEREIVAQVLRAPPTRGVPEREVAVVAASQVDGDEHIVALARVEAREQMVRPPEDGHGEGVRSGVRSTGVTTDQRNAIRGARLPDARHHRFEVGRSRVEVDVEDRQRVATHRGDVAHVHHDRAPPGEVRVALEQRREDALGGEQEVAGPVGDRGGVVPDEDACAVLAPALDRRGRRVDAGGEARDVPLRSKRGAARQARDALVEVQRGSIAG